MPSSMVNVTRPVMATPLQSALPPRRRRTSLDFLEDAGDVEAGAELVDHVAEHTDQAIQQREMHAGGGRERPRRPQDP